MYIKYTASMDIGQFVLVFLDYPTFVDLGQNYKRLLLISKLNLRKKRKNATAPTQKKEPNKTQ